MIAVAALIVFAAIVVLRFMPGAKREARGTITYIDPADLTMSVEVIDPVRYFYLADDDSLRFAAGNHGQLGPGSATMPESSALLHSADHAGYNLRYASGPMAHPGHRDGRMDEPATKRRDRVSPGGEPRPSRAAGKQAAVFE